MAREHSLGKGVDPPDLPTIKDFIHFHVAANGGKIVEFPTADSVNTFAEWFFASFTRVTGTPTIIEDRGEVLAVAVVLQRIQLKDDNWFSLIIDLEYSGGEAEIDLLPLY